MPFCSLVAIVLKVHKSFFYLFVNNKLCSVASLLICRCFLMKSCCHTTVKKIHTHPVMCVFLWSVVSPCCLMLLQEAEVWQQFREKNQSASRRFEHGLVFFPLFFVFLCQWRRRCRKGRRGRGRGFVFVTSVGQTAESRSGEGDLVPGSFGGNNGKKSRQQKINRTNTQINNFSLFFECNNSGVRAVALEWFSPVLHIHSIYS